MHNQHSYAEYTYEKASDAQDAGTSFWVTYEDQYSTAGDYDTAEYYLGYSLALSATANLHNDSVIWYSSMEIKGDAK